MSYRGQTKTCLAVQHSPEQRGAGVAETVPRPGLGIDLGVFIFQQSVKPHAPYTTWHLSSNHFVPSFTGHRS